MELLGSIYLKGITSILDNCNEKIEGNLICDVYASNLVINTNITKIRNLQYTCRGKKKICEIGVNACHSLLIMLLENPIAEYLLFDLNYHKYTDLCIKYICSQFPLTKITVIYGDSRVSVTDYIKKFKSELGTYDLCHIDGGHERDVFEKDYENIKQLSKQHSPVIFDDYDMRGIRDFIDSKISKNEITRYADINIKDTNLHIIYTYNQ